MLVFAYKEIDSYILIDNTHGYYSLYLYSYGLKQNASNHSKNYFV